MKILAITHDMNFSGAPQVLLNFLKWLKKHKPEMTIHLVSNVTGPRKADFISVCDQLFIFNNNAAPKKKLSSLILQSFKNKIGWRTMDERESFANEILQNHYHVILANTVLSLDVAFLIKKQEPKIPLILHVHEMSTVIDILYPNFKNFTFLIDKFIAVSEPVKLDLIEKYAIPESKISLIYEFIEPIHFVERISKESIFKVGACGYLDWRKGYDFFIQTALLFKKKHPNILVNFEWVGKMDSIFEQIIQKDLFKMGLEETVKFVGEWTNPRERFADFDVFLLTSREDPFPLAALEAAQMCIPIICFEKGTGILDLVTKANGKSVPYGDIEALVDCIYFYITHPNEKLNDGKAFQIESKTYVTEVQSPKIYDLLSEMIPI